MNPVSEDIKDILESESIGLTLGDTLFIGLEPTKPDNCVTIFDVGGGEPDLSLNGENYYHPSIQIRIRDNDYLTGWTLAENIRSSLHGRAHETWNGTYYSAIICLNGPSHLDWDENKRARFIINFNVQRR